MAAEKTVVQALNLLLADTFTLYLKTHKYHWNVQGAHFVELHGFFEDIYNELWQAVDAIAERIRALDEFAPGSYQEFAKLTGIKDGATKLKSEAMIKDLLAGQETTKRSARKTLELAEKAQDQATADFVTSRIQAHEKHAWMLRSLLEK